MNDKRNIVSVLFIAVWIILLATLMIRMPISYMTDNFSADRTPPVADIVFSACFCIVGIAAGVLGCVMSGRQLIFLSLLNPAMMFVSAICFVLYVSFFSRDVLAFALYFANPFCSVLIAPGFALLFAYAGVSVILPIIGIILLWRKRALKKKSHKEYKVMQKRPEQ